MSVCGQCGAVLVTDDPSPAEARVLEFVLDFHGRRLRFPTYLEIQQGLRLGSRTAANTMVHRLARKGWLAIEKYRGIKGARAIPEEAVAE